MLQFIGLQSLRHGLVTEQQVLCWNVELASFAHLLTSLCYLLSSHVVLVFCGAVTNHHKHGALKLHTVIILHFWRSKFQQRSFGLNQSVDSETGWDPLPQCLHLDTPLLKQQGTKKLYRTKNNCTSGKLGQILDKWYKETKKPKCHF